MFCLWTLLKISWSQWLIRLMNVAIIATSDVMYVIVAGTSHTGSQGKARHHTQTITIKCYLIWQRRSIVSVSENKTVIRYSIFRAVYAFNLCHNDSIFGWSRGLFKRVSVLTVRRWLVVASDTASCWLNVNARTQRHKAKTNTAAFSANSKGRALSQQTTDRLSQHRTTAPGTG